MLIVGSLHWQAYSLGGGGGGGGGRESELKYFDAGIVFQAGQAFMQTFHFVHSLCWKDVLSIVECLCNHTLSYTQCRSSCLLQYKDPCQCDEHPSVQD